MWGKPWSKGKRPTARPGLFVSTKLAILSQKCGGGKKSRTAGGKNNNLMDALSARTGARKVGGGCQKAEHVGGSMRKAGCRRDGLC